MQVECEFINDGYLSRSSALAMSRIHFDFVKRNYRDEEGNYRVKVLTTNIVTTPIEMLLSKGNPLLNRINDILLVIMESGLISFLTDAITRTQTADEKRIFNEEKVLKLDNLLGGFVLLFIGYSLSFVAFIGELLYFKYGKQQIISN